MAVNPVQSYCTGYLVLFHIPGLKFTLAKKRAQVQQDHPGQDREYADGHHQFDQGEAGFLRALVTSHCGLTINSVKLT
jgi:hypothetical protein